MKLYQGAAGPATATAVVQPPGGTKRRGSLERAGTKVSLPRCPADSEAETMMGRYVLLWLLGVPIPILLLIWAFGGLH
jgi:hypothetical protein